ncbi:uncharacterized protein L3040_006036 [Drepanopeziza brunnea f. sp. 'multigermtubi']|uniref:uncharacterized protein n=1 Tax=Drepanopeziza brunnea f. sp. 'multigermtubi' TaxID=698441 RepID=UPI0023A05FF6|nr:hypothetical protein L3040_006036 [Drepanopeziza brunnea f. sp. 'multigermtubi']
MAALAPVTLLLLRKTQDVFCNIFLRQLRSDPAFSEGTSSLIPASVSPRQLLTQGLFGQHKIVVIVLAR